MSSTIPTASRQLIYFNNKKNGKKKDVNKEGKKRKEDEF